MKARDASRPRTRTRDDEPAIAGAFGACAVVLAYAIVRALQKWLFPASDPRLVLAATRVAFFWNLLLAAYLAAMAVFGVVVARRRWGAARVDRFLAPLVAFTAVVGVAHAVLSP